MIVEYLKQPRQRALVSDKHNTTTVLRKNYGMPKLVSEQLPNDGGYPIKRLVNEANEKLKQIGRQGKRATIVAKKTSLSLQFTFKDGNGRPQKNVGLGGIPVSPNGILEAENIARMVTAKLVAGKFTWDEFYELIGKPTSEQAKQLTCKEMVEQYKKHFFQQRKGNKNPSKSWYLECSSIEKILGNLDKFISLSLIRQIVESKDNNSVSRKQTLNGLVGFLKYFNNTDYKEVIRQYKENNNPKAKKRNVPSDKRIIEVYETGFVPSSRGTKKYNYRFPQWQFLFGLLATYGLRIHEAWSIANWDKPVILKDGDWVAVDIDDDNSIELQRDAGELIIPAILDPNNKEHLLCIKHATKTGYRVAMPLSPDGHNWLEEFNLLQPLNLPDITNPLERAGKNQSAFRCTKGATYWFRTHKYGFKAHDLRHACNHRGHQSNYNHKALSDSLGHSVNMNSTGYLRHMNDSVKLEGIVSAINKDRNKRSRVEELEQENKALKYQLEAKDNKIKMLEAELKAYRAIEESKRTNS